MRAAEDGAIMRRALVALSLLAACGDNQDPSIDGEVYQYAAGALHLATDNTEARALSLDVDNDGEDDNQLGMVFATLEGQGFALAETAGESLLRGQSILLADVQTSSFTDDRAAIQTFVGASPVPAACIDPADLSTCGQHLHTRAHYDLAADGASDQGYGAFDHGVFQGAIGDLPITLGLGDDTPIHVTLHGARVRLTAATPTSGYAVIAGGFTSDDVDDVMAPAAARQMTRIVTAECGLPDGAGPCDCEDGGRADFLQELFDLDRDCTITGDELIANTIVASLLTPDVKIGGEHMLSFGFAVDLVPAEF